MRRVVAVLIVLAGHACAPSRARAQVADPERPTRAASVGVGWSTGIVGAEYVVRSFPHAPRLGAALGAGVLGPGARVTAALLPATGRLVPYAGAGAATNLWGLRAGVGTDGVRDTRLLVVLEGGVQWWPRRRRGLYVDLGAGLAPAAPRDVRVMPRVLVGVAF